jgi:hypothetical protein
MRACRGDGGRRVDSVAIIPLPVGDASPIFAGIAGRGYQFARAVMRCGRSSVFLGDTMSGGSSQETSPIRKGTRGNRSIFMMACTGSASGLNVRGRNTKATEIRGKGLLPMLKLSPLMLQEVDLRDRIARLRGAGSGLELMADCLDAYKRAAWEACREFGARRGATFFHGDKIHFDETLAEALKDFFIQKKARGTDGA